MSSWVYEQGDGCAWAADKAGIARYGSVGVAIARWSYVGHPPEYTKIEGSVECPSCRRESAFSVDTMSGCDSFGEATCASCGSTADLAVWAKGTRQQPILYVTASTRTRLRGTMGGPRIRVTGVGRTHMADNEPTSQQLQQETLDKALVSVLAEERIQKRVGMQQSLERIGVELNTWSSLPPIQKLDVRTRLRHLNNDRNLLCNADRATLDRFWNIWQRAHARDTLYECAASASTQIQRSEKDRRSLYNILQSCDERFLDGDDCARLRRLRSDVRATLTPWWRRLLGGKGTSAVTQLPADATTASVGDQQEVVVRAQDINNRQVYCPSCDGPLRVPGNYHGRVRCRKCQSVFVADEALPQSRRANALAHLASAMRSPGANIAGCIRAVIEAKTPVVARGPALPDVTGELANRIASITRDQAKELEHHLRTSYGIDRYKTAPSDGAGFADGASRRGIRPGATVEYDRSLQRFRITVDGKTAVVNVSPSWRGLDPQWVLAGISVQCAQTSGIWLPSDAREQVLALIKAGL